MYHNRGSNVSLAVLKSCVIFSDTECYFPSDKGMIVLGLEGRANDGLPICSFLVCQGQIHYL